MPRFRCRLSSGCERDQSDASNKGDTTPTYGTARKYRIFRARVIDLSRLSSLCAAAPSNQPPHHEMVDAAAFDEVGAPATVLLEAALHVCGDADIKHAIATVQQAGVLAVHRTARLRLTIYGAIALVHA